MTEMPERLRLVYDPYIQGYQRMASHQPGTEYVLFEWAEKRRLHLLDVIEGLNRKLGNLGEEVKQGN